MSNKPPNITTMSINQLKRIQNGMTVLIPEITNPKFEYSNLMKRHGYKNKHTWDMIEAVVENKATGYGGIVNIYTIRTNQISSDRTYILKAKDEDKCMSYNFTAIISAENLATILRTKRFYFSPEGT